MTRPLRVSWTVEWRSQSMQRCGSRNQLRQVTSHLFGAMPKCGTQSTGTGSGTSASSPILYPTFVTKHNRTRIGVHMSTGRRAKGSAGPHSYGRLTIQQVQQAPPGLTPPL